jgi:hypothetical protein
METGKRESRRHGAVCAALFAVSLMLIFAPAVQAAPYEPNDTILSAAGPIAFGQTWDAALETASDKDFFYFYVTSPKPTPVTIAIRNLAASSEPGGLNATIVDSAGTPVDAFAYFLRGGDEATGTMTLEPQKYFLEVGSAVPDSESIAYSFTSGGGEGAFGSYTQIAGRCAKGVAAIKHARRRLSRAQGKLQRAKARLRQSAYGGPGERVTARAKYRKTKRRVVAGRKGLNTARSLVRPWCSIPQ